MRRGTSTVLNASSHASTILRSSGDRGGGGGSAGRSTARVARARFIALVTDSSLTSSIAAAVSVSYLLCSAAIFAAALATAECLQIGRGYSPLGAGLRFLPWTATPLVVAPLAGVLFDRFGARRAAGRCARGGGRPDWCA